MVTKKTTKKKTTTTKKTTKKNFMFLKKNILEVKDIKKNYGKLKVLKGISFNVKEGEKIGIIGANGSGKSTLAEIISQIKEPSSGEIKFSFGNDKKTISKKVGIQFQESTYPMFYKSIDIINFFLDASKASVTKLQVQKLIKVFHLEGIENKYAQDLSGGQRQKLNVLLAVIHNPKLLLLDEVSTGLDIEAKTDIKKYIKKYLDESHATLILISHNIDELDYLVDRIIVIHDGKIFADLTMSQIKKKYGSLNKYSENLFLKQFKKQPKTQWVDAKSPKLRVHRGKK